MKIIRNVNVYDFHTYSHNDFVAFEEKIITRDSMKGYNSYIKYLRKNSIDAHIIEGEGDLLMPGWILGENHIYSDFQKVGISPSHFKDCEDRLGQLLYKLDGRVIDTSNIEEPNQLDIDCLHQSILIGYHHASEELGCKFGRIENGYEADLMIIPYDATSPMTENNVFHHFINSIVEQTHPKELWIKGVQRNKGTDD